MAYREPETLMGREVGRGDLVRMPADPDLPREALGREVVWMEVTELNWLGGGAVWVFARYVAQVQLDASFRVMRKVSRTSSGRRRDSDNEGHGLSSTPHQEGLWLVSGVRSRSERK